MQNIAGTVMLSAAKNFISSRRYNALKIERWDRLAVHRSGARTKLNSSRGKSWPGFEFLPGRNNFIREIVGSIRARLPPHPPSLPPDRKIYMKSTSRGMEGRGRGEKEGERWKRREEDENREETAGRGECEETRTRGGRKSGGIHGFGVAGTNRGGEWRGYPYFESLDRAEGLLEFITVICPSWVTHRWKCIIASGAPRSFNDIASQVMSRVGGRLCKVYVGNPIDRSWR